MTAPFQLNNLLPTIVSEEGTVVVAACTLGADMEALLYP